MNYIITSISGPFNPLSIGQRISEEELNIFKSEGEIFTAQPELPTNYVTDVSGNIKLQNQYVSHIINEHCPVISIPCLGFVGVPSALLQTHGLYYYSDNVNTLIWENAVRLEERLAEDDFDWEPRYEAQPISHLELSVRTSNRLEQTGIETIGELVKKTEADLLEYRFFGRTQLNEVKESLMNLGLTLGMV